MNNFGREWIGELQAVPPNIRFSFFLSFRNPAVLFGAGLALLRHHLWSPWLAWQKVSRSHWEGDISVDYIRIFTE